MSGEIQNVTCPLCGTEGFSTSGLRQHHCNGVNRQTGHGKPFAARRLTSREYVDAVNEARRAQVASTMSAEGVAR